MSGFHSHHKGNVPQKLVCTVLSAVLLAGAPAAAAPRSGPDVPALAVTSSPPGAAIYVDGNLVGTTPDVIETLTPGDHRVRLSLDGFLENSRVLSVAAGQTRTLDVALTPDANARLYATQVEEQPPQPEKKGGSGKKIALIGLGVAAVGAGVYLATRASNKAPIAGSVTASPSETGLEGATNFSFTAQGASDPDGDALTFTWNFGDGASGTGQTASHTYANAGGFPVSVTVSDGELTAQASGNVNVRDVTGNWGGSITIRTNGGSVALPFTVSLSHNNTTISGSWSEPILGNGTITGSVSSQKGVRLTVRVGGFEPFTMAGTADAGIDRISGTVTGSGFTGEPFSITRR